MILNGNRFFSAQKIKSGFSVAAPVSAGPVNLNMDVQGVVSNGAEDIFDYDAGISGIRLQEGKLADDSQILVRAGLVIDSGQPATLGITGEVLKFLTDYAQMTIEAGAARVVLDSKNVTVDSIYGSSYHVGFQTMVRRDLVAASVIDLQIDISNWASPAGNLSIDRASLQVIGFVN